MNSVQRLKTQVALFWLRDFKCLADMFLQVITLANLVNTMASHLRRAK